ncbi:MAG: ATP synthase F1 subunit epsilon [bacterium]|nr:ATP synthase F1 subunit epsilon [bacterium]
MSIKQLKLKIVTPERLIFEGMVDSVTVSTTEGEIGIFPDHVPLVAGLKSGDIVAKINGEDMPIAVVGGFVEVNKNEGVTTVVILADFAEHVYELTDEAIEKAKSRADELKKQMENNEVVDFEHFESELERSITRIKIADKWRSKKYRK